MPKLIRYIGIMLVASGLAILAFIIFVRATTPKRMLSPVPDEVPVEGVRITPAN